MTDKNVSTELSGAGPGRSSSSTCSRAARSRRLINIEDWIFTEWRIRFYGSGVAVAYALSLIWRFFHGQWIFLSDGRLRCTDFGWMWLSGKFAASGEPAQIFDRL